MSKNRDASRDHAHVVSIALDERDLLRRLNAWFLEAAPEKYRGCGLHIDVEAALSSAKQVPGESSRDELLNNPPLRAAEASTSPTYGDALNDITKFVDNYFAPWGAWKTAWWEDEVSDDAAFCAENALKAVANKARRAAELYTRARGQDHE